MTQLEMMIEAVANAGVAILCIITTSILLRTWYQVDNKSYPRWALIAVGLLYTGYSIRRLLNVIAINDPIWHIIVFWDCVSVVFTTVGMFGQITLAGWVKNRVHLDKHDLEEIRIRNTELEAKVTLLETQRIMATGKV